jgi:hypothetical protein
MTGRASTETALPAVLAAALLACGGCRSLPPAPDADRADAPPPRYLLEGFEADPLWTLDSADNYGTAELTAEHATQGRHALRLTAFNSGRGKTMFRREVNYDLHDVSSAWLDGFNHTPADVPLALAFRTAAGGVFQTAPQPLTPGLNLGVTFDLTPAGLAEGSDTNAWAAARDSINRVMLLVFPGDRDRASLTVDNLRVDGPGASTGTDPRVLSFTPPPPEAALYTPVELSLTVELSSLLQRGGAGGDPVSPLYAPAPLSFQARCIRPDGTRVTFHGFRQAIVTNAPAGPSPQTHAPPAAALAEEPHTVETLRFALDRGGTWQIAIGVLSQKRWVHLGSGALLGREEGAQPGPVGIDPRDRHLLAFRDGTPFYPIGQNVCWAADYEPYLQAIQAYGGNVARVWICPWNHPLLPAPAGFELDPASASAVDKLLRQAARRGIRIQLVFAYHGWIRDNWAENPFNQANGGPCALPEDFWINRQARRMFRQYLRSSVHRWAAMPGLFGWELMNEVNLTPRYDDEHVIDWHREMSEALKNDDPFRHLVTTSVSSDSSLTRLWEIPWIDLVTVHTYNRDLAQELVRLDAAMTRYGKPYWIQEIGRGWNPETDQADRHGRYLHHALWLSLLSRGAGAALPWWWDTYIEPLNLYPHFRAVAAFHQGEDRGAEPLVPWTASPDGAPGNVRVQGLLGRSRCYGFLYDAAIVADPAMPPQPVVIPQGRRLAIRGMLDGNYRFELWDTAEGRVIHAESLACRDGVLTVRLPAITRNAAFKVKALTPHPLDATIMAD